jgi:hypothetical protein
LSNMACRFAYIVSTNAVFETLTRAEPAIPRA